MSARPIRRPAACPRRAATLATALTALVLAAGCDVGAGGDAGELAPGERGAPAPARSGEEKVIRGWNAAVRARDFRRAGRFFAPGAIVEQSGSETRLKNERAAALFSAALPCRARVTAVRGERRSSLATFDLSGGPRGACDGRARVRFVIRGGRIREWRQLLERGEEPAPAEPAPGESSA